MNNNKNTKQAEQIENTAHQTAGHALSHRWHHLQVQKISIIPERGLILTFPYDVSPVWEEDKNQMEFELVGRLAGIEASRRFAPGSSADLADLDYLVESMSNGVTEETARLALTRIHARNLVQILWPGIQLVAKELLAQKVLEGDAVQRLLADALALAFANPDVLALAFANADVSDVSDIRALGIRKVETYGRYIATLEAMFPELAKRDAVKA